jgi:hypothetical protein
LDKIRRVFQRIDEAFRRIQQNRVRLEARLRNTVRYAGRRADAFLRRSEQLILRLDQLAARHINDPQAPTIPGPLETPRRPFAPTLLARPQKQRLPIGGGLFVLPEPDPLRELKKQLERSYLTRINVRPRHVLRFLERRVPPFGSTDAKYLPIETLDDFLAFETLRQAVHNFVPGETDDRLAKQLAHYFEIEIDPNSDAIVDNDWLTCKSFRIHRKTDHVTLESDFAD